MKKDEAKDILRIGFNLRGLEYVIEQNYNTVDYWIDENGEHRTWLSDLTYCTDGIYQHENLIKWYSDDKIIENEFEFILWQAIELAERLEEAINTLFGNEKYRFEITANFADGSSYSLIMVDTWAHWYKLKDFILENGKDIGEDILQYNFNNFIYTGEYCCNKEIIIDGVRYDKDYDELTYFYHGRDIWKIVDEEMAEIILDNIE